MCALLLYILSEYYDHPSKSCEDKNKYSRFCTCSWSCKYQNFSNCHYVEFQINLPTFEKFKLIIRYFLWHREINLIFGHYQKRLSPALKLFSKIGFSDFLLHWYPTFCKIITSNSVFGKMQYQTNRQGLNFWDLTVFMEGAQSD